MVALWRYLTLGVVPENAIVRAASPAGRLRGGGPVCFTMTEARYLFLCVLSVQRRTSRLPKEPLFGTNEP